MESVGIEQVEESSVSEDINDLEQEFGYYRPILEEDEDVVAARTPYQEGEDPWKGKSCLEGATAEFKAWRKRLLIEAYARVQAKKAEKENK